MRDKELTPRQIENFASFFSKCSESQLQALFEILVDGSMLLGAFKKIARKATGGLNDFVLIGISNHIITLDDYTIQLTEKFRTYLQERQDHTGRMARCEIRDEKGLVVVILSEMR